MDNNSSQVTTDLRHYDSILSPVAAVDEANAIVYFNHEFTSLFYPKSVGLSPATVEDVLGPEALLVVEEGRGSCVNGARGPLTMNISGLERHFLLRAAPISTGLMILSFKEQSASDFLWDHVIHSSKLESLGAMTASLYHDLRNPLTVISHYIKLMRLSLERNELSTLHLGLGKMEKAMSRIMKMVEFATNYTRNDRDIRSVDMNEVIRDALVLLESKVMVENIQIEVNVAENLPQVDVLGMQMEQVLMNLISNACDALKEKNGLIKIKAWAEQNSILFSVSDNGDGMDQKKSDRIFTSFYTTKARGEGTGLGLAIVKNIVDRHSGAIHLRSQVGGGSTFTVSLPLEARFEPSNEASSHFH